MDPLDAATYLELAETSPAAATEVLVARLRAGTCSAERLRVAAALGHEPARAATGTRVAPLEPGPGPEGVAAWFDALRRLGRDLPARARLAAARARHGGDLPPVVRTAAGLVEAWLREPGEAAVEAAHDLLRAAGFRDRRTREPEREAEESAAWRLLARPCSADAAWRDAEALARCVLPRARIDELVVGVEPSHLPATRDALLRWALGFDDPPAAPDRPGVRYSPGARYVEGEVVEHPTFGRGRVQRVAGAQVEVAFLGGIRKLVHARTD